MQCSCAQGTELIKKSLLALKCSLLFRMDIWMKAGWQRWPILTHAFSWRVLRKEMSTFASQNAIKHCNPLRYRLYLMLRCRSPNSSHPFISCNFPRQRNQKVTPTVSLTLSVHLFIALRDFGMGLTVPCKQKNLQRKHGWTLNSLISKFPTVLGKIND